MSRVSAEVTLCELRTTPLSVDEVLDSVRAPGAGAVCVFIGTIRNVDEDKTVAALDYSAHPQAGEIARALATRLAETDDVVRIAVVHRVGRLEIGETAVVTAVSAGHRDAAFSVCRELIDEFKATVPVWKNQQFADGQSHWVGMP